MNAAQQSGRGLSTGWWWDALVRAALLLAIALPLSSDALAQTLTIYDDALQNDFANYSYGGGSDFNSTVETHGGSLKSISLLANATYPAVSFAREAAPVTTGDYPALRFWVHGGAAGGQQLRLHLQLAGVPVGPAGGVEIDAFIDGGAIVAGEWREVVIGLASGAVAYDGSFDRIDLQVDDPDQPALYIDDIIIGQMDPEVVVPLQIEQDVTVASMVSDRFTWKDSRNEQRVAVLAHNDNSGVGTGGFRGGALREFRYQLSTGATRVLGVTSYGNAGYGGFGYVVSHTSHQAGCVGDDSPLGGKVAGTYQRVFEGRHHVIFRFTQNYPRNCSTSNVMARTMPVTIDWLIRTGQDHPLWAITWHVDDAGPSAPVGTFFDDTRAPYGELNIDGNGAANIDGVAWGDRYKFTSTTAPVTLNSHWTWDTANVVPYVKLWIAGPLAGGNTRDATMGLVQTQTMTQQDAGGGRNPDYDADPLHRNLTYFWGKTSADGDAGNGYRMPWQNEWPYQANAFSIGTAAANNNARLTWGSQYGFLGQATYDVNDLVSADAPGFPKKSYSVYVVMDAHTRAPVEAQVTQVETVQSLVVSAVTGSVVATGPAGVGDPTLVTYDPPGYNHVYGALAFEANANEVDANIEVGAGTLENPLIIVSNYTGGDPEVTLDGVALVADVDFFASLRADASELWLTLDRGLAGAVNHLQISGGAGGALAAPVGFSATASSSSQIDLLWSAVAGAASYEIHRRDGPAGFALVDTTAALAWSDAGLPADTAYVYKVRAIAGAESSPFSTPDEATTVVFADDPLNDGTKIKVAHFMQLRTAVDALRAVAGLPGGGYTDPLLSTTVTIKTAHLTELRAALDEARGALLLPDFAYTDPVITVDVTKVKKAHAVELRDGVK